MPVSISPMLAVRNAPAALDFYAAAFGAVERWRIDAGGTIVAGMEIDGAPIFLAEESPPTTRSPLDGGTSVRIELFVDDPAVVWERAVAAGATAGSPITERHHDTVVGDPVHMLQGGVTDPFGHIWLIGRFL